MNLKQQQIFVLFFAVCIGAIPTNAQDCSQHASFVQNSRGEPFGLITIHEPDRRETEVKVVIKVATRNYQTDSGGLSLAKSNADSLTDVQYGQPLLLHLALPVLNPLPKITEIYVNGRLICANSGNTGGYYAATISYYITFSTNLPEIVGGPPRETVYLTRAPVTTAAPTTTRRTTVYTTPKTPPTTRRTTPATTRRTTTAFTTKRTTTTEESPYKVENMLDNVCGVADFKKPTVGGLIRGGNAVVRGQFPWMAAYFYTERFSTNFICGGSLISSSLVVTAAHCVESVESDSIRRKPELSTFYIGKNNLESLIGEANYVSSQATHIHVHPNWKQQGAQSLYESDIAIAVLIQSVVFNKFVKPLCIWRETSSYEDIINKQGKVAGWGKTDESAISSVTANYVTIPAVSNEKCLKSHARFHSLLGDNAFCGGVLNAEKGPCNGDSGGAYVFEKNGKAYLRGIVSAALLDEDRNCDVNNYVVFTDVSKFTDWIDRHIEEN